MEPKPASLVLVAAGLIFEEERILLTQRKSGTHLAGAWEFPGGKVEPDEDPRDALARELAEELGIDVEVRDIVEVTYHRYATKNVLLLFYECARRSGSPAPRPLDVADLKWAALGDLRDELFPPADVAVLAKVRARLTRAATTGGADRTG